MLSILLERIKDMKQLLYIINYIKHINENNIITLILVSLKIVQVPMKLLLE